MARKVSMKMIPAMLLLGFSGAASASGFQLMEQNASGIGNAFAGSAAVAENASTIYYNPAGMTQLQEREVSIGASAVNPSFKFSDQGSNTGGAFSGNGGDAGGWSTLPNGYASWAVNKDVYLGIGFGAPFGLKTEYDNPWTGAAQATKFEVKTYNVNPSIAYRVSEKLSLGGGLNWQKIEAEYTRQASTTFSTTPVKMNLGDSAWGWNIGALYTVSPSTKVGFSYRSAVQYHTIGSVLATGPIGAVNAAGSSDIKAALKVPDTFIMSVTQKLSDKWEMLGDVSRTGWSSIPKVEIIRTSGASNGALAQTLDTAFRNAWRVALGANYQYNSAWKLKFGVAYDQTPVRGADTRLTSLPDNDRVWFSTGAQWVPDRMSKVDLGIAYIYVRDSKINNNQLSSGRGLVTGEYAGNIWVLGAQYSRAF